MKKIFTAIFLMAMATFLFAQNLSSSKNNSFEFKIADLVGKGFYDEIKIRNGSSYELKNIQIKISINGKSIELIPIANLQPGNAKNFDGKEDDDMHDELKYFFGNDGKLSKTNQNIIAFDINFGDNNEKITIKDFFIKNKDLYFFVEDNPNFKNTDQATTNSAKIVTIDGKKYILVDDKAFEIQQENNFPRRIDKLATNHCF